MLTRAVLMPALFHRRHLFVAQEKAAEEVYDSDGELITSGRPLSGQDASSIPYDQVERELKRMLAKTKTDPRTNESMNPLVEEMWNMIDFQGMGLISVATMDKFISKRFHVLKNSETLLYAYKLCANSNRSSNLSGPVKSIYCFFTENLLENTDCGARINPASVFSRGGSLLPSSYADVRSPDDAIAF